MDRHETNGRRQIDWERAGVDLDENGYALLGAVLDPAVCASLVAMFEEDRFRKHIVMEHHGYGEGEYKYFRYPLPQAVQELREGAYPPLAGCANRWAKMLRRDVRYPATLSEFLARCRAAGQTRPTPLILRYTPGGYNRLHQDLYGEVHFPLQLVVLLSKPGQEFTGGEIVITEQRARMQARASVLQLDQGEAALIAVHDRPVRGVRRPVKALMRHGVSKLHSGERLTLGVIFHDAV